ncbi:MAG: protoporphyrinogen oxidase, partial [Marmoricola sp.]|nr:protoporphyrinogen oxidase [Marmoricola sp.]
KAATFSFAKWAWVREAGAAGTGDPLLVLRCSLGRHREEQTLQRSDEELVALALADLTAALGPARLTVPPVDTHVQRWGGALPQYAVGHLVRVADVRREVAALPGLAVCGSTYDGVGIPACIASAHRAVAELLAAFGTLGP